MYDSEKRRHKGSFSLGPFALIFLGIVFLLNNFGILPWEIWQNIWKFWPVLLILFGVEILVGKSSSFKTLLVLSFLVFLLPLLLILNPLTGNPLANSQLNFSKPLGNLTKVEIISELPSNNLKLGPLENGSDKVLTATVKYSKLLPEPELSEEKRFGEARYTLKQPEKYLPFAGNIGNSVDLKVSRLLPISLTLKANAGVFNLNFDGLHVNGLEIESGTAKVEIDFGKSSSTKAFIKSAASQVTLNIPKEIPAKIKMDFSAQNIKIDQSRFRQEGNLFITNNFEGATQKVEVEISGSVSNLEIR